MLYREMNDELREMIEPAMVYTAKCMLENKHWQALIDAVDEESWRLYEKKCTMLEGLFGYDKHRNHTNDYRLGIDFALIVLKNDIVHRGLVPATEWKVDDCFARLNYQAIHCVVDELRHSDTERMIQRGINDVKSIFLRKYNFEVRRIVNETDW